MPAGADAAGLAGRAGLTQLPPELRLQIFAFLLRCRGTLQRRSTVATEWLKTGVPASLSEVSHDQRVTLGAVDPSPFLLCKKLRDEALDVFYDLNRFKIHFNHLCTCHGRFNVAAFDESRIRHLDLYDFYPRQNEKAVCAMCERSGLGLFDYLNRLPRLQLVTVAFEDFMSITDFVQSSRTCGVRLEASEVGCFQVAGPRLTIELRMPLMNQAWRNLITMNGGQSENLEKPPGEESVRHALEYLQFEANDWGRVPTSLYEYFVVDNIDGMAVSRLGLKDQPNGSQRILAFTVDLAEVLGDLFIEDCMTESLQWKYIGLPETLRWDFRQGMISV